MCSLKSVKQGCCVQVGRLCTVQGHLMERWMGAEIQPMFFSPGHAPWWGCIPWRKTDSFVVCTEAPHGPAVTLQGPHAIGSQWVELELGGGGEGEFLCQKVRLWAGR